MNLKKYAPRDHAERFYARMGRQMAGRILVGSRETEIIRGCWRGLSADGKHDRTLRRARRVVYAAAIKAMGEHLGLCIKFRL